MAASFLVVLTTLPSRVQARRISSLLLKERLAACVNLLGPVESSFWWQGEIDKSKEYLLLIKTRASNFGRLRRSLQKNHPYSVPEIIALPIQRGNARYLDWLEASIKSSKERRREKP